MSPLRASLAIGLMISTPAHVHAGMPSFTLSDVARLRVHSISFFLMGFLVSAGLIQLLWNWLRKDFVKLPRLSYAKALGVVGLWGLLFVLVLTMISGARELMTPGAWEKSGLTYKLAKSGPAGSPDPGDELARRQGLDRLRVALWKYAGANQGGFPASVGASEIAPELWQLLGASGLTYLYVPGQKADQGETLLAYEPELDGDHRLVLLTNGEIRRVTWREMKRLLPVGKDE
jgi:hypothetical protein